MPDALKSKRLESLILCSATLGDKAALHKVYAECPCPVQKGAALVALVRLDDAKAAGLVVEAVKAKPSRLRQAALQMIVTAPSGKLTTAMVSALGSLEPATRAHVVELLGKRGDEAALPALAKACAEAKDDAVRTAAGKAVAELGGPEHVRMLLGLPNGPAIVRPMAVDGVDNALIALLDDKGLRAAAIQALAQRRTGKAADRIIALTGDADEAVRASAWSALPDVATEDDAAKITPLMIKLPDGPERDRAAGALRALISGASNESKNKVFQQLAGHYKTTDTKMRQYILGLGPAFATKEALAMETDALQGGNDGEQDKALQALSAWPNPDPCPALLKTASEGKAKTQKILALRAYLELSAKGGSNEQKIERFTKAKRSLNAPRKRGC